MDNKKELLQKLQALIEGRSTLKSFLPKKSGLFHYHWEWNNDEQTFICLRTGKPFTQEEID